MDNRELFTGIEKEHQEASLARRNLSGLIDAVFIVVLASILFSRLDLDFISTPRFALQNELLVLLLLAVYRFLMLMLTSSTLGMGIAGITLLNPDFKKLNILEKLLAAFFVLFRGVDYYKRELPWR